MKLRILPLLSLLPVAFSKVTFKLVAPKGKPSVVINNASHAMKVDEYPVYKVEVNVKTPVTYYYTIDYKDTNEKDKGVVQESFNRVLNEGSETLNEFFDRSITVREHPSLPKAYPTFEGYSPSKLYDDTHVSTIIINANQEDIDKIHSDPTSGLKLYGVEFIYTSPYSVRTFKNATLSISGQSTIYAKKLSYKVSNLKGENNKELFKRTGIKLRAEHMDPSFLRDKIYTDILNSLGVPTSQSKYTRLFINGEPIGLFVIYDNVSNKRFLRETLNKGTKFEIENPLFKADYFPPKAYGDLGYYGPSSEMYGIYYYKGGSDDDFDSDRSYEISVNMLNEHLIPFLKQISEYPETKKLPFDIETYLKFMAMEFMSGAVDNYWSRPGNYFLFKNMNYNNGQWYFLDSDFHYSFGIGGENLMSYLNTTIDSYASLNGDVEPTRPLLDSIRSVKENEEFFKQIFARLISTSFHVDAIFPRIDSLGELIKEDVIWDSSLPRVSGYEDAEDFHYNYDDFNYQVSEVETAEFEYLIPIKYWIKNKGELIAQELGIEYPAAPDNSLGVFETSIQSKDSSSAYSIINNCSITLVTLICLLFSFIIYY